MPYTLLFMIFVGIFTIVVTIIGVHSRKMEEQDSRMKTIK